MDAHYNGECNACVTQSLLAWTDIAFGMNLAQGYDPTASPFLHNTLRGHKQAHRANDTSAGFLQTGQDNQTGQANDAPQFSAPVAVSLNFRVLNINKISMMDSTFEALTWAVYSWIDERLYYEEEALVCLPTPRKFFIITNMKQLWVPDICTLSGQFEIIKKMGKIFPYGKVQYMMYANVKVLHDFDLHMFPFDAQKISLKLQSFSYPSKVYRLENPSRELIKVPTDPVVSVYSLFCGCPFSYNSFFSQGVWKFIEPLYDVNLTTHSSKDSDNKYQDLTIHFYLARNPTTYICGFLLPLGAINMATFLALWQSPEGDHALNLCLNTVICAISYMYVLQAAMPKVCM